MSSIENQIREFYGKLKFPGEYQLSDFDVYEKEMLNSFLKPYDVVASQARRILDIGCGSGFISNLLAYRYPNCHIDAVDFSDSLNYAREFALKEKLQNINHFKQNFLNYVAPYKYDVIISNGVLHHMPEYHLAIKRIDQMLKPNGTLVVGLYNTWGKLAKQIIEPNYINDILYQDQEMVPFELTFLCKEVKYLFHQYQLIDVYPGIGNQFVDFLNLFNYNNGGLTIYTFQKNLVL